MKPDPLLLALAKLLNCPSEAILSYREYPDGSVVAITPSGAKQRFRAEDMHAALSTPAPARKRGDACLPR